jgi:hypothetical protein
MRRAQLVEVEPLARDLLELGDHLALELLDDVLRIAVGDDAVLDVRHVQHRDLDSRTARAAARTTS